MPDFWEFPTVFHGPQPADGDLSGALQPPTPRGSWHEACHGCEVWAFLGDGETDEPESLGAITSWPSREKLDNLIFCHQLQLQRLDGPVRGNGQIIQELESAFRGARWNVIKGFVGKRVGPPSSNATTEGLLVKRMGELVDGEYQKRVVSSGRVCSRGISSGVIRVCSSWSSRCPDEALRRLRLGGHDPRKGLCRVQSGPSNTRALQP